MDKASIQEAIVSNFAQLLGSKAQGPAVTAEADDFSECLSEKAGCSDVVCTIPAMEMKVGTKSKDAMPNVGSSFSKPSEKPTMAASVLDASNTNSESATSIEKRAVQTLGSITSWTRSTLVYAPQAAAKNISTSFSSLVATRIRAWTLLLLRHSLTTGDAASRSRLLSMLSSKVEVMSTTTLFKTLSLPDSANDHVKEADVILPLLFEANMTISLQGKNQSIFLRAPGTVAGKQGWSSYFFDESLHSHNIRHFFFPGHFAASDNPGLIRVDIRLDTNSLFESMVEQARLVVLKAVARATAANTDSIVKPAQTAPTNAANLSSFNSALNLSPDAVAQSPQLQKAQSSAMRLNSVLHGKSAANGSLGMSTNKVRKIRSVQWDHALEINRPPVVGPPGKRPKVVQSHAKLRSFRSFGRPHGGEGGREANNATFGDFGRAANGPIWGRDGKMAYHPTAGGGLPESRLSNLAVDSLSAPQSNRNATFNINVPPRRMKRTATALESWLLSNATR